MTQLVPSDYRCDENLPIVGKLLPHQTSCVKWMMKREYIQSGGILADDMGLGKTYQIASLIASHPVDDKRSTLIVTVVPTISQWQNILHEFVNISPFLIPPNSEAPLPERLTAALTTYSVFQQAKIPSALLRRRWQRIVLDEGHYIKDVRSKTHINLNRLIRPNQYRWILSGTPIQNNKQEMKSLLHFVGCDENEPCCVMRRTLQDVCTQHAISVPRLTTRVKYLMFKYPEERLLYDAIINRTEKIARQPSNVPHHLDTTLRLRQVCIHPQLVFQAERPGCNKRTRAVFDRDDGEDIHQNQDRDMNAKTNVCTLDASFSDIQLTGYSRECLYRMQYDQLLACAMGPKHDEPSDAGPEIRDMSDEVCADISESDDEDIRNISDLDVPETVENYVTDSPCRSFVLDSSEYMRSTKMEYIVRKLIRDKHIKVKSLVFCKFRAEMDIICKYLERANVCFCRYDGDMSKSKRECSLFNFKNTPGLTVMIVQIQAGGVGLNLQCATRVYITAPEWNPVVELQAIARVYRLNQQHEVKCTRVIMSGTVEEWACMKTEREKVSIIAECLADASECDKQKLGFLNAATMARRSAIRYDMLAELVKRDRARVTTSDPTP